MTADVPQQVCSGCGERAGELHLELTARAPAGHEAKYYCSQKCLRDALDREGGGVEL